ncbi:hypothetical protein OF846_005435 [Rhodotorula toruloides]|nr:hypothetical protein OF846_005435 [Rhodotorula toruloides]
MVGLSSRSEHKKSDREEAKLHRRHHRPPEMHFLRVLHEHWILPCMRKMMVSSSLDPSTLIYACCMERGDLQLVTCGRRGLQPHTSAILPLAGPTQAALKRVGTQIRTLQAALSEPEGKGFGCPTLLKAAKVLHDKYELLASAAPTMPQPAATTRSAAPTKTASIYSTTTSKPTCSDTTTPALLPVLTLKQVDKRIQSAI